MAADEYYQRQISTEMLRVQICFIKADPGSSPTRGARTHSKSTDDVSRKMMLGSSR